MTNIGNLEEKIDNLLKNSKRFISNSQIHTEQEPQTTYSIRNSQFDKNLNNLNEKAEQIERHFNELNINLTNNNYGGNYGSYISPKQSNLIIPQAKSREPSPPKDNLKFNPIVNDIFKSTNLDFDQSQLPRNNESEKNSFIGMSNYPKNQYREKYPTTKSGFYGSLMKNENLNDFNNTMEDGKKSQIDVTIITSKINEIERKQMREKNTTNMLNLDRKKEYDSIMKQAERYDNQITQIINENEIFNKNNLGFENEINEHDKIQKALLKENEYLRSRIVKLGERTKEKISELNLEIEGNHYRIEQQRETLFIEKNQIDDFCDEILKEMNTDYQKNEKKLETAIQSIDSEVEAKKMVVKEIRTQFEKLRVEQVDGLRQSEEKIRKDEYERHMIRYHQLEDDMNLASNDLKQINSEIKFDTDQVGKQKTINKRESQNSGTENRELKGTLDILMNEFKSIEDTIMTSSEKFQMSRNEVSKLESTICSLKNVGEERQKEYDNLVQSITVDNEAQLREGELIIQELDRAGDIVQAKFEDIMKKAEYLKEKQTGLYLDVEAGMKLTLHNVVHDY